MKNNEITILPDTAHADAVRLGVEVRGAVVQVHVPSVRAAVLRRRPKVGRRLGEVEVGAVYVGLHEFFLGRETPAIATVRTKLGGSFVTDGDVVGTRGIPGPFGRSAGGEGDGAGGV